MPVKINCEYCGKETFKQPYQIQSSKHHFCSRECFSKYRIKYRTHKKPKNMNMLKKILYLAEKRNELYPNIKKEFYYV